MPNLKPSETKALKDISKKLNIPDNWLYELINFESKFDPFARNPRSGARGLIQFINSTAKTMGFTNADQIIITHPTIEMQLRGPVYEYLKKYQPFPTELSLYMSVFYPVARNWNENKWFPLKVRQYNPGINTPKDYYNYVKGTSKKYIVIVGLLILILLTKIK